MSEGPPDDEPHALYCNTLVRRCLDKRAITYEGYKNWRKKNPSIFTTIVDKNNNLIGFFDIFPITHDAGEAIISGKLTERSLSEKHLLPLSANASATHIHIATILLNPRQHSFSPVVAKEVMLLRLKRFLERVYPPIETRTYTAFGQTKSGEALLTRCGFSMTGFSGDNDQHMPLYVLRPATTAGAASRFERADGYFSSARKRRSDLKELDARIEEIELQLRAAVTSALDGDVARLPANVKQRAGERIGVAGKKNAALDGGRYRTLAGTLEYCDLRELEETIKNKLIWPHFEELFATKEALAIKFSQVAELRNGIRHSRTVDEIVEKEGEAGILWFEQVLRKKTGDADADTGGDAAPESYPKTLPSL